MRLFLEYLEKELKNLSQAGVRLQIIGDVTGFAQELQERIAEACIATAGNEGIVLTVAANYGGQWDIVGWRGKLQNYYYLHLTDHSCHSCSALHY